MPFVVHPEDLREETRGIKLLFQTQRSSHDEGDS